jgi:hypothetical protein
MIALDTDELVRFLVADDAEQHRQVVAFIAGWWMRCAYPPSVTVFELLLNRVGD